MSDSTAAETPPAKLHIDENSCEAPTSKNSDCHQIDVKFHEDNHYREESVFQTARNALHERSYHKTWKWFQNVDRNKFRTYLPIILFSILLLAYCSQEPDALSTTISEPSSMDKFNFPIMSAFMVLVVVCIYMLMPISTMEDKSLAMGLQDEYFTPTVGNYLSQAEASFRERERESEGEPGEDDGSGRAVLPHNTTLGSLLGWFSLMTALAIMLWILLVVVLYMQMRIWTTFVFCIPLFLFLMIFQYLASFWLTVLNINHDTMTWWRGAGFWVCCVNIAFLFGALSFFISILFQKMTSLGWIFIAILGFIVAIVHAVNIREHKWKNIVTIFGSLFWVIFYTLFLYAIYASNPLTTSLFSIFPIAWKQNVYDYIFFPITFLYGIRLFLYCFLDSPKIDVANPQFTAISFNDVRVKYLLLLFVLALFISIYMNHPSRIPCYVQSFHHQLFRDATIVKWVSLFGFMISSFVFLLLVMSSPKIMAPSLDKNAIRDASISEEKKMKNPIEWEKSDNQEKQRRAKALQAAYAKGAEAVREEKEKQAQEDSVREDAAVHTSNTKTKIFQGFRGASLFGIIAFVTFCFIITIIHFRNPKNPRSPLTGWGLTWVIFLGVWWSVVFVYKLFRSDSSFDETTPNATYWKTMLYRLALLVAGITTFSFLINWAQNLGSMSASKKPGATLSIVISVLIFLCFLSMIAQVLLNNDFIQKNLYYRLFVQIVFLIPCGILFVLRKAWGLGNGALDEVQFTRYTVFYLLASIIGALVVVQFLVPRITDLMRGGTVLVMVPHPLVETTNASDISFLTAAAAKNPYLAGVNSSMSEITYNYSISFWVFLDVQPTSTDRDFLVIDLAGIPQIVYNPSSNITTFKTYYRYNEGSEGEKTTTKVTTDDQETFSKKIDAEGYQEIYRYGDLPLQRWNNIVYQMDGGTVDIFLNGELLHTEPNVIISVNKFKTVVVGQDNGLAGSVCNFLFYDHPLTLNQIRNKYDWLKNEVPPIELSENMAMGSENLAKNINKIENDVNKDLGNLFDDFVCNQVTLSEIENSVNKDIEEVNMSNIDIGLKEIRKWIEDTFLPWHFSNYLPYEWYDQMKRPPSMTPPISLRNSTGDEGGVDV